MKVFMRLILLTMILDFIHKKLKIVKYILFLTLATSRIKWQQLMSNKGKASLTAQQIARAERAEKRRVDKEKSQQVIIVTTNPTFNLTPSPGPIRADEAIVSSELVKHPNSPAEFQGQ